MTIEPNFDRETEWLQLAPPVGLVVSALALKEVGLIAARQTPLDTGTARELIAEDVDGPALADPWNLFASLLGWRTADVAGAPGGPPRPEHLTVRLTDLGTTLEPTWAVRAPKGVEAGTSEQLLVRVESHGVEPDAKKALDGWEATPQQRFERLLRETKVCAGVLVTDEEIRLVYAPQGETSGWQVFPIRALATVPGRPILGGLKLLLDRTRFFGEPTQRLTTLLKRSREAQATVSTELSAQVLGALHELNRGLLAAEKRSKGSLVKDLARKDPHHLYEGLLTVLMRLVFVLYAEDRDLIPSRTEHEARWLYEQGYSVRGLFARLTEDEALNPDTMDERVGGWGQMLALFRLVHGGHKASGFIRARGGKLFDPDAFLFLEGRARKEDAPSVMAVSDGCLLRILRGLMVLRGERLSYRALDVEAIGSVYETVMGFTVETTKGASVAIKAGKNNKVPVFVDLDAVAALKPADRIKFIKEETGRALTGRTETEVKTAKSSAEVLTALEGIVDERGSPERRPLPPGSVVLQPTEERRRTGSHYTPRSLTLPIVQHALEPTFERLGPDAMPAQILDLKVCDPAMGSGAFLVEACRQLGVRLQQAWKRWPEQKPKVLPEDEDEELHAKRLVAQRCLYGIDKNPMATDLAKLSLWLATLARDHEFEFVDHALKTGDSLVGLTNDQIAGTTWETDNPGLPLFRKLVADRINESNKGRQEIRDAPDNVFRAVQEARHKNAEERIEPIRVIGDAVISAFFAEGKSRAREKERQRIESQLTGALEINLVELFSAARRLAIGEHPIRPFHWQLEFPEVFEGQNPGFDSIVGNPPFLGGKRISSELGFRYNEWLELQHARTSRNSDLAGHFYRRAFTLLKKESTFGLIATKTIAQGDTRTAGLAAILTLGGTIMRATQRHKWQGEAAIVTSFVHVRKGAVAQPILDGRPVRRISAYLVEGDLDDSPKPLVANARMAFVGSYVLGTGFTFDDQAATKGAASTLADMRKLIAKDPHNAERIFPFIGGDEVNNDPKHSHHRYAIDFFDRPLMRDRSLSSWSEMAPNRRTACLNRGIVPADYLGECAEDWPDLVSIIRERVKSERDRQKRDALRERWWQYADKRPGLYASLDGLARVFAIGSKATAHCCFAALPTGMIYSQNLNVICSDKWSMFGVLSSRVHEVWAKLPGGDLGDTFYYPLRAVFPTFPFPPGFDTVVALESTGQAYNNYRAALMTARNEGLTKTYNRFHDPVEESADIVKLRELHEAMDRAVLTAYGWTDLAERIATATDAAPRHLTEETEDDYKYQGRYFWPAPIRDEVLARLLALNAKRAQEERLAGLTVAEGDGDETNEETEDVTEGS